MFIYEAETDFKKKKAAWDLALAAANSTSDEFPKTIRELWAIADAFQGNAQKNPSDEVAQTALAMPIPKECLINGVITKGLPLLGREDEMMRWRF